MTIWQTYCKFIFPPTTRIIMEYLYGHSDIFEQMVLSCCRTGVSLYFMMLHASGTDWHDEEVRVPDNYQISIFTSTYFVYSTIFHWRHMSNFDLLTHIVTLLHTTLLLIVVLLMCQYSRHIFYSKTHAKTKNQGEGRQQDDPKSASSASKGRTHGRNQVVNCQYSGIYSDVWIT